MKSFVWFLIGVVVAYVYVTVDAIDRHEKYKIKVNRVLDQHERAVEQCFNALSNCEGSCQAVPAFDI